MSRSALTFPSLAHRYLLIFALASSLSFVEMEDSFAINTKEKSAKSFAPKNSKRTSTSSRPNTLLNGLGAPSASLGINGDFYIDTLSMNIYGPKKKNAWPVPKSLVGPQGVAGAVGASGKPGANGKDGRDGAIGKDGERGVAGSSSSGVGGTGPTGPAGPAGATGPAGPSGPAGVAGVAGSPGATGGVGLTGPAGPAGPSGPAGVAGAAGATGATGAAGAQGVPGVAGASGAQGVQGETGLRGLQGVQGAQGDPGAAGAQGVPGAAGTAGSQGPQGSQGIQGVQGIPGPVKVYFSSLSFPGILQGTAGVSKNSTDFGTLVPGKLYLLTAFVYTTSEVTLSPPLSAAVFAVGAEVNPVSKYSSTSGTTYRDSILAEEWGLSITSTVDGSGLVGNNYQLRVVITCGTNTTGSNAELIFAGYYLLQEVGNIN